MPPPAMPPPPGGYDPFVSPRARPPAGARTSPWLKQIQQRMDGSWPDQFVPPQRKPAVNRDLIQAVNVEGGGRGNKDALLPYGYATLGPIAQGAFSRVMRARPLAGGDVVAVKTCALKPKTGGSLSAQDLKALKNEITCLELLQPHPHAHVANLIGSHEAKYEVHLVLHYCGGGTLQRSLKSLGYGSLGLEERVAVRMLSQVCGGGGGGGPAGSLSHTYTLV